MAQKDTAVYYLKNSGRLVSVKDSADIFLVVLPPDTNVDKKLFVVKAFYSSGKLNFLTSSTNHYVPLNLQGSFVGYYPNGHKKVIKSYQNGVQSGDIITFFPNGHFYNEQSILDPPKSNVRLSYDACNDSLGHILTENGEGTWITYNEDFSKIIEQGKVRYGFQDSVWTATESGLTYTTTYRDGVVVEGGRTGKIFTSVTVVPEFPGGINAFMKFLGRNIRYPATAKEANIQGKVFISFVVERDGSLSDIRVVRGVGGDIDQEALRVIKLSPKWIPGSTNGIPVRVAYSVPINFTLTEDGRAGQIN